MIEQLPARTLFGALLVSLLLLGCNRVPGQRVEVPGAKSVVAKVTEAVESTVEAGPAGDEVAAEEEALESICDRACEHWVGLRFADPIGFDRIRSADQDHIGGILERQRAHNLTGCRAECVESGMRDRARCILRAMTADECNVCASSF